MKLEIPLRSETSKENIQAKEVYMLRPRHFLKYFSKLSMIKKIFSLKYSFLAS